MGLTSPSFNAVVIAAAVATAAATLLLWNRIPGPVPARMLARLGLLITGEVLASVAVLATINLAYGGFFVSWQDLLGHQSTAGAHFAGQAGQPGLVPGGTGTGVDAQAPARRAGMAGTADPAASGRPAQTGPATVGSAQAGPAQAGGGPSRGGASEAGPSRGGTSEAGPSRGGTSEAGPSRGGTSEAGPSRVGPDRIAARGATAGDIAISGISPARIGWRREGSEDTTVTKDETCDRGGGLPRD